MQLSKQQMTDRSLQPWETWDLQNKWLVSRTWSLWLTQSLYSQQDSTMLWVTAVTVFQSGSLVYESLRRHHSSRVVSVHSHGHTHSSTWKQCSQSMKGWLENILAYLIGSRASCHSVEVKGHRRCRLQRVSVKPVCHPVEKDTPKQGGREKMTSSSWMPLQVNTQWIQWSRRPPT